MSAGGGRRLAAGAAMLVAVAGFAGGAGAYEFGQEETIHRIVDVEVTSADFKPLFLGFKTTTLWIGLGAWITDDGYVFGARNESDTYYPTDADELKTFQLQGLVPSPLPAYSLSFFDYLLGYSLWITIVAIGGGSFIQWLRKRNAPPEATPETPAPP